MVIAPRRAWWPHARLAVPGQSASAQHATAERVGATLSEAAASHFVYLSQPEAVATLIAQAAADAADR